MHSDNGTEFCNNHLQHLYSEVVEDGEALQIEVGKLLRLWHVSCDENEEGSRTLYAATARRR